MKANELRTGNKVYFEGMLLTVKEIKEHDATFFETPAAVEYPDIDPVPLSAEILEACGLVEAGSLLSGTLNFVGEGNLTIEAVDEGKLKYHLPFNRKIEVKHLHQLQNLYFALTGTELTFNAEKVKP